MQQQASARTLAVLGAKRSQVRMPQDMVTPKHDKKLRTQLTALDAAIQPQDLGAIPSWRLHALKGDQAGRWSITVNGNWRLTFGFEGADVVLLEYEDCH